MRFSPLFCLSLVAALSIGSASQAQSQSRPQNQTVRTPLAAPIQLTGQSGGNDASACGNINRSNGKTIRVTESFTSLSFEVESEGDYTLLITGPDGFRECVFSYDNGTIQAPGLLERGQYRLYVGDRSGESHPYTISISQ